ncbi:MAG TPA: NAD-dependent epimerase/dehydratase family protein [Gemmatimonadaceae bacterium]|nr:NAD-dependent epimerase/dehydratase family protein [Gemmatimonadaceae bacterium]
MPTRRTFLKTSAAVGGALVSGLTPGGVRAGGATRRGDTRAGLEVLVLGGTGFIGPHLVRHAVTRGHRITIFTRGRHQAELPEGVIHLQGDRNGQLAALEGKRWDAVVDDSATNPDWVQQSARLLKDAVSQYLFTSSTGVYYPYLTRGIDESGPARTDSDDPKDGSASFGVAKAKCEREVRRQFGNRALIVRPTYIVGPGDTSDRFPYWPVRLARGGEVLAPGKHDDPSQFIDVRDLAEFMIRLIEEKRSGIYNVAGPRSAITMPEFLASARDALKADVQFTWVDDYEFLAEHKIHDAIPWAMLRGNDFGMMSVKSDRAVGHGLSFRPLAATVRDTLAWWPSVPDARRAAPRFTITPEKEAAALAAWHTRRSGAQKAGK